MIVEIILIIIAAVIIIPLIYSQITGTAPIPTPKKDISKILDLAEIKPNQKFFDLGCGDGRIAFAAASRGANSSGIEIFLPVIIKAWLIKLFRKSSAKIIWGDMLKTDLRKADIVFTYMMPDPINKYLVPKLLQELKPSAKIISYAFKISDWPIAKIVPAQKPIYLYERNKLNEI